MEPPQSSPVEEVLRAGVMAWLAGQAAHGRQVFDSAELARIPVAGTHVRAVAPQQGIWKPAGWSAALTIRTTFTPPGHSPPYDDDVGPDGRQRYKYRGTDPDHHDNRALRAAMVQRLPLVWFIGIRPGWYLARAPVWLVDEEPALHQFVVAVEPSQRFLTPQELADPIARAYIARMTRQRVHQPVFRERVLDAYEHHCTVCKLHHDPLLDAAHIIADTEPDGEPSVVNGLSLCKIHHAAYDADIMGITPDLEVRIRPDVLDESDGPMLLHGLQSRHGQRLLWIPRSRKARPNQDRLDRRYQRFLEAV